MESRKKRVITDQYDGDGKNKDPEIVVTKAQILARPRLQRSKSINNTKVDPEGCRHQEIIGRGGHTHWWTCKACGLRWPRDRGEVLR